MSEQEDFLTRLQGMGDNDLATLLTELEGTFQELYGDDGSAITTDEDYIKIEELGNQILTARETAQAREQAVKENTSKAADLREKLFGGATPDSEGEGDDKETAPVEEAAPEGELVTASAAPIDAGKLQEDLVKSITTAFSSVADNLKDPKDLNKRLRLGTIAEYAPDAKVPVKSNQDVLVASADVPGFTQGGKIDTPRDLARAFYQRARTMPVSRTGNPDPVLIASKERQFTFNLDKQSMSYEMMNDVLQAAADPGILTAAGGWCAPSETSYSFYSVVCEDGMLDIPTVGVTRGGFEYPTSPSFGDITSIPGLVWTWTEQDDIDALTSDSILKPCVHVQCPEFIDRRLDCDGFCVTAGNLMDFSYPEAIENWIELVMAARAHATNANIINIMINGGGTGDAITPAVLVDHTGMRGATTANLLNSIELSVIDYRESYRMCDDAVLEVVLPRWAKAAIRADLANREGIDYLAVTDAMIADWFNIRDVRVQFVTDWQVDDPGQPGAATPLTGWDQVGTVDYLIYAAGTFVRGNGLSLNLGVVRDSVLNATNDHTAAWAEDCYAIGKPGHEARLVTVALCDSGQVGARDLTCSA